MERVLKAESLQLSKGGKRGWLLLTEKRLVFAEKDNLSSKELWSVPLTRIESAIAADKFGHGLHKFTVHYVDGQNKRQEQEFTKVEFTKGILLGGFSKVGGNPLTPLESAVSDQIARAVSATASGATTGSADVTGELERLAGLKASGALTDSEFAEAKARVLAGSGAQSSSVSASTGAGPFTVELVNGKKDESGVIQVLMNLHKDTAFDKVGPFHAQRIIAEAPTALRPDVPKADAITAKERLEKKGATVRITEVV